MNQSIKLQTESILHVPLDKFEKDFTFIVNGEEFKTTKFVADLLSQKITKTHLSDPTIDHFIINTKTRGNFTNFLNLCKFEPITLSNDEIPFLCEIIEELEPVKIKFNHSKREYTIDNVLEYLFQDLPYGHFHKEEIETELDFISTHFNDIEGKQRTSLLKLPVDILSSILSNRNLIIESEEQLLKFINDLYSISNEYSILYEFVYFTNVQANIIEEFLNIFDIKDLNRSTWLSISNRLKQEIQPHDIKENSQRYKNKIQRNEKKEIKFTNKEFEGIFDYFRNHSNIKEEVKITASSVLQGDVQKVVQIDSPTSPFNTKDVERSWVCFEFVQHKITPTNYTIRSNNWNTGSHHLKSWIIEGSEDGQKWIKIDDVTDSNYLNGPNFTHTFSIQNENKNSFKFIRILQTNRTWHNDNYLCFNSFEIYGLID